MSGQIIQVNENAIPSMITCGHCKNKILIDITPFGKDVSNVLQDKCPKCHGTLYVGVLILSDVSVRGLGIAVQACVQAMERGHVNLVESINKSN